MATTDDKRRQKRVAVDLWIEVDRGGELYFQRATNLSSGGAFFDKTIPLPVGTRVSMRFSLPGEDTEIACEGNIVNTAEWGMGVEFIGLPEEAQRALERVLSRLSP